LETGREKKQTQKRTTTACGNHRVLTTLLDRILRNSWQVAEQDLDRPNTSTSRNFSPSAHRVTSERRVEAKDLEGAVLLQLLSQQMPSQSPSAKPIGSNIGRL